MKKKLLLMYSYSGLLKPPICQRLDQGSEPMAFKIRVISDKDIVERYRASLFIIALEVYI